MRKTYPALEYYAKPPAAALEKDSDEDQEVDKGNSDSSFAETKNSLRESFVKKIDFVTTLWRKIESPEVAELSLSEFKTYLFKLYNDLEEVIPNAHSLQKECNKIMDEIATDSSVVEYEAITSSKNGVPNIEFNETMATLEAKLAQARSKLNNRLSNPDFEFVHHFTNFLSGIYLKRTKMDSLEDLPKQNDPKIAGQLFIRKISSFCFESDYGADSNYPIIVNPKIKKLIDFLRERSSSGENIFDFIKINPYDVCFYLNRKDFNEIYGDSDGDNSDSNGAVNGVRFNKTSIIMIAKDDNSNVKNLERVKRHEQGHNLVGIVGNPDNFNIHNTIYKKTFLNGLRGAGSKFNSLFNEGKKEEAEKGVREYMQTAVNKLNGEISADAKNIVLGYPRVFAKYVDDLILHLNEYVIKYSDSELQGAEKEVLDSFLVIVREEIEKIKIKARDLFVRITTYAYVARKYGLEDEFCSALVLMPDSDKYLRRVLSIKLGEDFDFVSANKEIDPSVLFADEPNGFKIDSDKYFGPDSVMSR